MKETDKEYYARRGKEERGRSRTAGTQHSRNLHAELADLCQEESSNPANENGRNGIRGATRQRG
jgi:hypothetical protein